MITLERFQVIPQRFDKHVVIPDIHGEFRLLQRAIELYWDDEDVGFAFGGDLIDRKGLRKDKERGVFRSAECVSQLGARAISVIANHELWLAGSTISQDPDTRSALFEGWTTPRPSRKHGMTSIEQNTLSSYGVDKNDENAASRLLECLEKTGHDCVFFSATPYYETDKMIITHAGTEPDEDWEEQKVHLEAVASDMALGDFPVQIPPQWSSFEPASPTQKVNCTDKIVVSGHSHTVGCDFGYLADSGSYGRSYHDGKRICLASEISGPVNEPLYIWQDWDGKVVEIK